MRVDPLSAREPNRFVDELWLPGQREMAAVSEYELADGIREDGLAHRRERLDRADAVTSLARREGRLLGYAAAAVRTPPPIFRGLRECHVNELYVVEDARRDGVGTRLLEAVEDWARRRDCSRMDLNVHRDNRAAVALYEEAGYDVRRYNMKKSLGDST